MRKIVVLLILVIASASCLNYTLTKDNDPKYGHIYLISAGDFEVKGEVTFHKGYIQFETKDGKPIKWSGSFLLTDEPFARAQPKRPPAKKPKPVEK